MAIYDKRPEELIALTPGDLQRIRSKFRAMLAEKKAADAAQKGPAPRIVKSNKKVKKPNRLTQTPNEVEVTPEVTPLQEDTPIHGTPSISVNSFTSTGRPRTYSINGQTVTRPTAIQMHDDGLLPPDYSVFTADNGVQYLNIPTDPSTSNEN